MLDKIAEILMERGLVSSTWQADMEHRGDLARLYREYFEGNHRLKLTKEMRQMMQITDERLDRYNANYCEMVVTQVADRLTVDKIEVREPSPQSIPTPNPSPQSGEGNNTNTPNPAQEWVDALLEDNRFDGLQIDVREAGLRDGVTFVMAQYDDASGQVMLAHELAWDGDTGVMVVYDRQGKEIVAGVKVWWEGDTRRANIYYPNSIERFRYEKVTINEQGQEREEMRLNALGAPEDTTRKGMLPGVPLVPFFNKSKKGTSELVNVIPLQDSLNSTLISAVMNALLTAFSILFAKGWQPPSGITPGMVLNSGIFNEDGSPFWAENKEVAAAAAALNQSYDLIRIQPGEVEPLLKQCEFIIKQIGTVSLTPVPGLMGGDSQSGEALQERRIGQLGKVTAAQVRLGNSWENVALLAHRLQTIYGNEPPPAAGHFDTRWKNAELRNDANVLKLAEMLFKWGFEREALRRLSQLPGIQYSDEDIAALMEEKAADATAKLGQAVGNVPDFGGFNFN